MVMDSLRYWVTSFHVDGFRFDLGATLGRQASGFDPELAILRRAAAGPGPAASEVDLRALGPRPRRLSTRPPPAGFRRMERPFPRQHAAVLARRCRRASRNLPPGLLVRAICSSDTRAGHGPRSTTSPSHDGFTLTDVVSYAQRHNEANGEDNNDGQRRELFRQLGR